MHSPVLIPGHVKGIFFSPDRYYLRWSATKNLPEHPACPDQRTTIQQNPMTSQRSLIINAQVHYTDKT